MPTARFRAQRDDRPGPGQRGGAAGVDLAADRADVRAAPHLRADLAEQVDLDGGVHRHQ
jgi:hypothetical protein